MGKMEQPKFDGGGGPRFIILRIINVGSYKKVIKNKKRLGGGGGRLRAWRQGIKDRGLYREVKRYKPKSIKKKELAPRK